MWNFILSFTPWVIVIALFIIFVRRLNDPDLDIIENLRGRRKEGREGKRPDRQ